MKRPLFIWAALALLSALLLSACAGSTPVPATTAPPTNAPATSPDAPKTGTTPAASPAASNGESKPDGQAPKYGGTLRLALTADVNYWDDVIAGSTIGGAANHLTHETLWSGDWAKGYAGGYGTKEDDWGFQGPDLFSHKAGYLAESWQINVDDQTGQAAIVYKIRPGVRYALNQNSEASRQVGGREVTADDVVATLKAVTTDSRAYIFRSNPELRNIDISKTGPMEVTVKVPVDALVSALSRLGDGTRIYPEETLLIQNEWKNSVGTGPFILTNYVSGSSATLVKNPSYWMKDPIGPGKGNQLPYLDGVEYLIIPDTSTRLAAFRTGKIDQITGLTWEDSDMLKKEFPNLQSAEGAYYQYSPMYMRTDKPPFNDIKVRHALMMATDFNTIKKSINGDRGVIITFPYEYYEGYAAVYLGLDDPATPASIKELYTYNPDKAKKLLAEAGHPNGFKTSIMVLADEASYFEMIASMWSKVGVELAIDVKDNGVRLNILNQGEWDGMTSGGKGPVSIFYNSPMLRGKPSGIINSSHINDPYIDESLTKIRRLAATNESEAMALTKEMSKHVIEKAYAIPRPSYRTSLFWWPWVKNYSGESSVGYFKGASWSRWAWIDQQMKRSMGY